MPRISRLFGIDGLSSTNDTITGTIGLNAVSIVVDVTIHKFRACITEFDMLVFMIFQMFIMILVILGLIESPLSHVHRNRCEHCIKKDGANATIMMIFFLQKINIKIPKAKLK